jgi:hypothetical protein
MALRYQADQHAETKTSAEARKKSGVSWPVLIIVSPIILFLLVVGAALANHH